MSEAKHKIRVLAIYLLPICAKIRLEKILAPKEEIHTFTVDLNDNCVESEL
jgi:hypothetical protein